MSGEVHGLVGHARALKTHGCPVFSGFQRVFSRTMQIFNHAISFFQPTWHLYTQLRYIRSRLKCATMAAMVTSAAQYLDAHLPPEPLLIPNFWAAWQQSCLEHFPGSEQDATAIDALHKQWKTGSLFMHLDDGLEHLLLADRANSPLALTDKHWLSLIWLILSAYNGQEARHTTALALQKASDMYKKSQGCPLEGIQLQEWIDRGPWQENSALWTLLFKNNLALVHPTKEPLYWALRQQWLLWEDQDATLAKNVRLQESPPDMSSWALPRPMNLENVQNVLRLGKRWSLRMGSSLTDAAAACIASPQWTGVYLVALWLVEYDAAKECSIAEQSLFRHYLVPTNLAYWLMLAHDHRHHKGQYRQTVDHWGLNQQADYACASNLLEGLQMLASHTETQLALAAWAQWHISTEVEALALPELV